MRLPGAVSETEVGAVVLVLLANMCHNGLHSPSGCGSGADSRHNRLTICLRAGLDCCLAQLVVVRLNAMRLILSVSGMIVSGTCFVGL